MRLEQLQKRYITEGWNDPDMLLLEQKVIQPWVSDVEKIVTEANLSADQIKNLFTSIEQGATAAGSNRTAIGKGADAVGNVASAINKKIDDLGAAIKKAGPVQNMDAKFNELKQKIGDKDSKVVGAVKAVSDWAKANPGKATVAVAILTSAAAMAGGPLGGAVAGFLARATKDILQGKELSTAVGKSIKTGAVGALAGGAIQAVGDLIDPDISQAIIASDGQTIDVSGLEAMKATSLEDVSPEAIEDLLKTQNALETAAKNVSAEEREIIMQQFSETSKKIGELGGRDALADYAGLEGQDLARDTTTYQSTTTSPGADGETFGDTVETVPAETITSDQLKDAGINFDTEPNISPEVQAWAESKGLDVEQVQKLFQMEKAMADAKFMGTEISANKELATNWTGDTPTLGSTTLPDGSEIKVGDTFKSEISSTISGIEPPLSWTSEVSIEGVDADGNPVMVVKSVSTMPNHPMWDQLDNANLSDEDIDQFRKFLSEYSGEASDSKAGIDTIVNTFKQDLAKGLGAAATAVAMSVAMQDKKVVAANAPKAEESKITTGQKLSEGQVYLLFKRLENVNTHMLENKLMFESVFDAVSHYHRTETLTEFDKGGLSALGGALKKGAKAAGGAIAKGAKAAGGAISGAAKQVTTKVTAEKLMSAWKKAGSPTDSAEVYDVIKGLGVADDVIKGTYDSMKIEVPAKTDAPDADADPGAADAETNADAPTDSTAGDSGSTPAPGQAADADAAGADTPGGKEERYLLQKNQNDPTKVDIIDKQTSKPVKDGVGLAPEKAEPMSDKMNKEAGAFEPKGERYTMQPSATDPKKFDVVDKETDKPVEGGANIEPGAAEELSDKLNKEAPAIGTADNATTPTDQVDANNDGKDDKTGNPMSDIRGNSQGQNTAAPGGTVAPVDINALAAEIKKLKPEQIEAAKKLLAA